MHRTDLGVDELCRVFSCCRATLYRLFQPDGGLNASLRDLRLSRCFQEFAACGFSRDERVGNVAERWGFTELSYFHRLFKQRYGLTPGDVMAMSIVNPSVTGDRKELTPYFAAFELLRGWLERF